MIRTASDQIVLKPSARTLRLFPTQRNGVSEKSEPAPSGDGTLRGRIDIAAVISYTGLDIAAKKTEISQGAIYRTARRTPRPRKCQNAKV
eukprot:scaffold45753_cov97-Phaeocystis_antarctica.AAC.1